MTPPRSKMTSSEPGPKPQLKWIPITDLYVDHGYQRGTQSETSQKSLRYLTKEFSWAHCGALIATFVPAKKKYAVVDGQHRLEAAIKRRDIDAMPCVIIQDRDYEKQASAFSIINTKRVRMNPIANFHASAAAGDPNAKALRALLAECKITIPKAPVPLGLTLPRETQAIGSLLSMLGKYSSNQIKWALTIIPEAYGDEKGQMRSSLIKALAEFAKCNPAADKQKMIGILRDLDPSDLQKDAQSYVSIKGGSTVAAMVMALDRLYKSATRKGGK